MTWRRPDLGWGLLLGLAAAFSRDGVPGMVLTSLLDAAPALVLAYLLTGVAAVYIPAASIAWLGRGSPLTQAVKGTVIGLPLPLCSCSVVPMYHRLATHGATPTAAMAFLVAGPELGLDAVFLSLPFLGLRTTLARIGVALAVAVLVAVVVGRRVKPLPPELHTHHGHTSLGMVARMGAALTVGFGEILSHTFPWVVVGIVVAVVLGPTPAGSWLASLSPVAQVVVLSLVGLPAYICASAATPMVAALLHDGVAFGAAIAFLVTGPTTNVTTVGTLARLHGRRVAAWFVLSVVGLAVMGGIVLNAFPAPSLPVRVVEGTERVGVLPWLCLAVLAVAVVRLVVTRGLRWMVPASVHGHPHHSASATHR